MKDFELELRTKVYFGKKKEYQVGEIISSYRYRRVLIVTGCNSSFKTGLMDRVTDSLSKIDIKFAIFKGIRSNPTAQNCRDCLVLANDFKPDLLLAVGGGSVIDVSKNVACSYYYEGDPFDFNLYKVKPSKVLPIGVILTISAAGSEMSSSCVIQDDDLNIKNGFNSDLVRPVFVIENPELTYSLPKKQIAYGIVDMFMHTFERFMVHSDRQEVSDLLALAVLKGIINNALPAYKLDKDYESNASLMFLSSLAHNDLTSSGKDKVMPVHALEHCISGLYPEVSHAAGLAILFPAWSKYYLKYDVDKFDELAKNVFGLYNKDTYINGLKGIEAFERLLEELNMPKNFQDLGINNPDIDRLADLFSKDGTRVVGHYLKPLNKQIAKEIFSSLDRR